MQLLRCGAVCLKAGFRPERRGGTGAEGPRGRRAPERAGWEAREREGQKRRQESNGAKKEARKQWSKKEASKQWGKKGGKQARGLKGGNCEEASEQARRQASKGGKQARRQGSERVRKQ